MGKYRDYSNEKIYRIIGGMKCERLDDSGSFKCKEMKKLEAEGKMN